MRSLLPPIVAPVSGALRLARAEEIEGDGVVALAKIVQLAGVTGGCSGIAGQDEEKLTATLLAVEQMALVMGERGHVVSLRRLSAFPALAIVSS